MLFFISLFMPALCCDLQASDESAPASARGCVASPQERLIKGVEKNNGRLVAEALRDGAKVDVVEKSGLNPFEYAVDCKVSKNVLDVLYHYGAWARKDFKWSRYAFTWSQKKVYWEDKLYEAHNDWDVRSIQDCLEHGAFWEMAGGNLMLAIQINAGEHVWQRLQRHVNPAQLINYDFFSGITPLMWAIYCQKNREDADTLWIWRLLEVYSQEHVLLTDRNGHDALWYAEQYCPQAGELLRLKLNKKI